MALKQPLVLNANGEIEQLQAGDTIPGGAATITATRVEVDFGSTPVAEQIFTIADGSVTATSKIIPVLAYAAPTGKDLDELEMDSLHIVAGNCSVGQFDMYVKSNDGSYLEGKFKIDYLVAS